MNTEQFDEYCKQSEEIKKKIITLFDSCDVGESREEEISPNNLKTTLNMLIEEKEKVSIRIITQCVKGMIGRASIRKDGIYRAKSRSYTMGIQLVKQEFIDNMSELTAKVKPENLEVIDFIFQRIYKEELKDYSRKLMEKFDVEGFKIPEVTILEQKYGDFEDFKICEIDTINIDEEGDISFRNSKVGSGDYDIRLKDIFREAIIKKYYAEIQKILDKRNVIYSREIERLRREIKEIKDKGSNILMLYELTKQGEVLNGN